jgi:hypothetical protein
LFEDPEVGQEAARHHRAALLQEVPSIHFYSPLSLPPSLSLALLARFLPRGVTIQRRELFGYAHHPSLRAASGPGGRTNRATQPFRTTTYAQYTPPMAPLISTTERVSQNAQKPVALYVTMSATAATPSLAGRERVRAAAEKRSCFQGFSQ